MPPRTRQEVVASARTLIVKVGSNVLSRPDDTLDPLRIRELAAQIHRIRESGRQVVVVSRGAVAAGIGRLKLKGRPTDLPHLQAAAAAGQAHLIRTWDEAFAEFDFHAAQILVTANDFKHRRRYLNVSNTIHTLAEYGAVPVVNENDTVSIEEIKFGDNDRLAAMVANLLSRPLLVVLSIVDGLFDGDPADPTSQRIPFVDGWSDDLRGLALDLQSSRGTGGPHSKIEAGRGSTAVRNRGLGAGRAQPRALGRILAGDDVGTLFLASQEPVPAWKRWIGYTVTPRGQLHVDAGAARAVQIDGRSLLAIGITRVDGSFQDGEIVSIVGPEGREFARGRTNCDSDTARRLIGKRSHEITAILGHLPYDSVIHRDNLAVTRSR